MALGSPVVRIRGTVRRFETEDVPARPAVAAVRDQQTNRIISPARDASPGYTLATAVIDTGLGDDAEADSGLADVVWKVSEGEHVGYSVAQGDQFDAMVRPYIASINGRTGWFRIVRFGLARTLGGAVPAQRGARAAVPAGV